MLKVKAQSAVRGQRMIILVETIFSAYYVTLSWCLSLYMHHIKEFALGQFLLFCQDKMHASKVNWNMQRFNIKIQTDI